MYYINIVFVMINKSYFMFLINLNQHNIILINIIIKSLYINKFNI